MRWIRENDGVMDEWTGGEWGDDYMLKTGWVGYLGKLPLSRLDIVDGKPVELPEPEPDTSHDWQDKELFIRALYVLVPAERILAVMANAALLKDAVTGMSLLTTKAAPDGMLDMSHADTVHWLELAGVTEAQVKAQMAALAEASNATSTP